MKYKFLLLICLIKITVYSQTEKRNNYDVKSPNVSDFIRYGNIPTNMYVGELDLKIPLLSQGDIDLSLSYNSAGFMPSKRSGIVGLNWNLNGIGMITREVRGLPDDHVGAPGTDPGINSRTGHGFMVGMQYLKNANAPLPNGTVTSNPIVINYEIRHRDAVAGTANSFETTPDIFNFNVNGLSGKFFMTSDGKIKVISNNPTNITVDISNFNFQPYTVICSPTNISEFKIIDDRGNKYYFGGESKYLEYSLSYNKQSQGQDATASNPIINTWHIKRIEYFNGDITNFNYQNDEIAGIGFCDDPINWFKGTRREQKYKRLFFMTESVNDSRTMIMENGDTNPSGGSSNIYTLHKKAFLESITGNNFSINFTYSEQGFFFNNNPNLYAYFKTFDEYKLNNIKLQYGSQVITNIDLSYLIKGGTTAVGSYPRLFLDKVQEIGKTPYQFEYDLLPTQNLPVPSTCAVDFWGFYNGKLTNDAVAFGTSQLIAQSNVDANGDETFISNIRDSNFNFAKIGILKKVIYPTGGYSEFEYEPHTYSKRLERKSIGNFLPALYDVSGQVGGTRIMKISDFDGVQISNVKEFLYTTASNLSSGILMQWPRAQFKYDYYSYVPACCQGSTLPACIGGVYYFPESRSYSVATIQSSSINMNSIENSVMSYSRVVEKTINNGFKVFNFKDYINYPDNNDFLNLIKLERAGNLCGAILQETYSPENLVKNFYVLYNDRSIERGKIENTLTYDNSNNLLFKEEYLYNNDTNRFNLNSQYAGESNTWWYTSKQYYYNDYLTKKTTTSYHTSGNLVNIENSTYISAPSYNSLIMSNQDVLSKTSSTNSLNEIVEKEYKYPWQSYLPTSTQFLNFKSANILTPLRVTTTKNNVKLNESFTVFAKDASTGNLLLPKFSYEAKFPNNYVSVTDVGTLEKKVTYDSYDSKGNVTQYTPINGVPVSLIWGYNQTHLIAKLENVLYANIPATTISDLQLKSNADVDASTEQLLVNALNSLRTAFPISMISTYSYNPLIGATTMTDPKGDQMNYIYDSVGRLQIIKDKNGNVISQYQYHYKNQ